MLHRPSSSRGFSLLRLLSVLALFSCSGFLAFYSFAATPPSGTVTPASPITYTSGPFLISNPSGTAELMCGSPATPCDEFALTIPAGFDLTHNLVITTSWPNTAEDFDLYLLKAGAEVKAAASSSDPEVITADALPGTDYIIRIVPFAVAGGTTTTTVELVLKPTTPPPPPPGAGTPRYQNFAAPPALGNSAGEPTLAAGKPIPGTQPGGRTMYIAGLETLRVTWDDCASPASPLWEDRSFIFTSLITLDPILFGDFQTGRIFVSQLGPKTSFLAYTDNDGGAGPGEPVAGVDYIQSQGSGINSGVDHQTVGGGPFRPGLPDGTNPLYPNAVYYASQDLAIAQMGLSRDGGQTFGAAVPMYNLTQCGGLHGHIKVTPRTPATESNGHVGTVYLPNKGCSGQQAVVVSEDEGLTFAIRKVPGSSPGPTDPSVGIDEAGKLYFAFGDGDGRAKVAVSSDKGATWSAPIDVGAAFSIKNAIFPTAVGGSDGRATVMYLATDTGGNYQARGVFRGVWHIYAASTFDGGASWTTVRVTPENDPVQRGSICTGGTTCGADRNLLDFNDMEIDHEGRVIIAYADGCIGCSSPTGADSRADKATIARQSGGRRMLAAFDPPEEPNAPAAPRVTSVSKDGSGIVHVAWLVPDNGGAPITSYNVYRRESTGSFSAPLASVPPNKTTYDDATATAPGVQYFYKVTAVNSEGESLNCREFPVGEAVSLETVCILPGKTLQLDPTGDQTGAPGNTQRDIQALSIAELFDPNATVNKATFRLKVADLAPLPIAETRWTVFFTRADPAPATTSTEWFVAMVTDDTLNPGTPVYRYGHTSIGTGGVRQLTTDGTADAGSNTPDGTILITIGTPTRTNMGASGRTFPPLQTGETFTNVNAITQQSGGVLLLTTDSTGMAQHTLAGNASCAQNAAPIAGLVANPQSGDAPLLVGFTASASDADAGDAIVSYTFNFGDGSSEVTQAEPTINHNYVDQGNFRATVRVTSGSGARQKVSENLAEAVIEVGLPLQNIASRMTHGPAGNFDIGLPTEGPAAVEPRSGGAQGSFKIIYTFDRSITSPGTAESSDPGATETVQSGPGPNQVTVDLNGVSNAQRLEVTLDGVQDSAGANLTGVKARVGILFGDNSGDGTVNSGDITPARRASGQPTNSSNFRIDVSVDGVINSGDITPTRRASGSSLPQ